MTCNFISSEDSDEIRTMRTKSNNIQIMMGNETDEIRTFWMSFGKASRRTRRKNEGKWTVFDNVDLLHYNLHKVNLHRGGSNRDSPGRLKNKRATINK